VVSSQDRNRRVVRSLNQGHQAPVDQSHQALMMSNSYTPSADAAERLVGNITWYCRSIELTISLSTYIEDVIYSSENYTILYRLHTSV